MPRTRSRRREPAGSNGLCVDYRAVRLPSGRLLAIEVRVGRRLLRRIASHSDEARRLLRAGLVEIVEAPVDESRAARTSRPPAHER
ncbi:MAG: hypothetical protein JSV80_14460 [Acidobacteriota bacterium]|nr:MAG: hypothetical protein JSV80_14460 [Acidobacteriota bacterium]